MLNPTYDSLSASVFNFTHLGPNHFRSLHVECTFAIDAACLSRPTQDGETLFASPVPLDAEYLDGFV